MKFRSDSFTKKRYHSVFDMETDYKKGEPNQNHRIQHTHTHITIVVKKND